MKNTSNKYLLASIAVTFVTHDGRRSSTQDKFRRVGRLQVSGIGPATLRGDCRRDAAQLL